jgi:hypothetical protein
MIKTLKISGLLIAVLAVLFAITACHKPAELTKELALEILNAPNNNTSFVISIDMNNPMAHASNPSGWNCSDKKELIDADLVSCDKAGRSAVYLEFTDTGKKLQVGQLEGTPLLRTAKVIAVKHRVNSIDNITFTDKKHATVTYTSSYTEYTPFANEELKKQIPLNVSKQSSIDIALKERTWTLQ